MATRNNNTPCLRVSRAFLIGLAEETVKNPVELILWDALRANEYKSIP
jgi:hypothetical protein